MSIKVRAIARGFYGNQLRESGSEFDIESKEDLGKWMVLKSDEAKLDKPLSKAEKEAAAKAEKEAAAEKEADEKAEAEAKAEAIKAATAKLQDALKGGNKEKIAEAQGELDALQPALV